MANTNQDIFSRKRKDISAKNSSNDNYLESKKSSSTNKDFQERFRNPKSDLIKGQNVRLPRETHALIKAISLSENKEMYAIVQKSLISYLDQLDKDEQKEVWTKLKSLIDLKIIKL